ncbi:hypothetical protein Gbro_4324 [Gordonia bronchialis DSM 43247]|uniref:TetR family transcriptional regulator n=1 Tax=Gordonia bronchialis (strain ATCC 25592 / DSM 43247 / BCRC 13721 / JCM 3198 / KCTC 3076 / NBRC 16047 / NCTC 10667) TaxID=526226 RepID=D0L5Y1_GORB4|nr:hypothetical protein [Gordonia bronchialis]ACY23467.1 hypothetical protein Gbro_4324 [Gordonia bronchialis DSM 43247]MCC3321637.1 TetR/AcrR family transcriptional regulator [Gordonia bronchialis]QGS23165.1 TetR/AcrR family transcriptional regulator [Gordonia bronchialis]UAK36541.1 TetR/AcrR family transcriptional regulator [Gordonia bronchialis]STQ66465.1 Uncharacterised protein [Gordonia bronchialis]
MTTDASTPRRSANKRGIATREAMLDAAVTSLAGGDPNSVSGNRIAKDIGATWGVIKYQFGDIDGLWAAVLHHTAVRRGDLPITSGAAGTSRRRRGDLPITSGAAGTSRRRRGDLPVVADGDGSLTERVSGIVELMYAGLMEPDSRAIETLRAALPRDPAELERLFPKTAAELASWGPLWVDACERAFADLDVPAARVREVAAFLPGAMRGLVSEKQLGSYQDQELARRGLANAIIAYLSP